jgi:hypothetical protein
MGYASWSCFSAPILDGTGSTGKRVSVAGPCFKALRASGLSSA